MKRLSTICTVLTLSLAPLAPAVAQSSGMDMKDMDMKMDKGHEGMAKKGSAKTHHATGTVKSVDHAKGTVTVDHEAVSTMNWPAMTMTFKADKKKLQALKAGEKIDFDFVQRGKDVVITKIK